MTAHVATEDLPLTAWPLQPRGGLDATWRDGWRWWIGRRDVSELLD